MLGQTTLFISSDGQYSSVAGTLWGFHVEDTYKASQRTTLTLGLRYDPYFPFRDTNGIISCFAPGKKSNVYTNAPAGLLYPGDPGCNTSGTNNTLTLVQPRVGIAQRLGDKTSLRAVTGFMPSRSQSLPLRDFQPRFLLSEPTRLGLQA
jgi:hypothetical protein